MNKSFRGILICCLLLTAYSLLSTPYCLLLYAYPPGWSGDILLTPEDMKYRGQPDVDVDGYSNVWAVWDSGSWVSGTAEILCSKRDSLGGCLIPENDVSNNASFSHLPRVAVDNSNNVQFIWRDASPQGDGIWHAKLANDGSVLVPAHLAVSGAGGGSSSLLPEIVINRYKEINIIWDENPSGYNQMNYTKLDSSGNSIIPKMRVSPDSVLAFWPGIGVDSFANNHLGYRTNRTSTDSLVYSKLDKDGNVLIGYKVLCTGLLPTFIADRSQNIHIVYWDPAGVGNSIKYLKINQNGNILVGPKTLSIHENNNCPHMAMDSLQYLHVVWDAESAGAFPVMYAKIDTMGDFVIPPMQVVYPPYTQGGGMARIAVDHSNRLHLVWVDQRLNPGVSTDIFYKRGENVGIEEASLFRGTDIFDISIFPNPFSRLTYIKFQAPSSKSQFTMRIYDATGRLVRDFSRFTPDALHPTLLMWDGTDNKGNRLASGVYFVCLSPSAESKPVIVVMIR